VIRMGWEMGKPNARTADCPRVWGSDLEPVLAQFVAGDVLLVGNNQAISHCAVYVGDGEMIHAMATEYTLLGFFGAAWSNLMSPIRRLLGHEALVGVIREQVTSFFDRYERDTWVWLHREGLDQDQRTKSVRHIERLVGAPYDYIFRSDDDAYYCSEVVLEFLGAAEGSVPMFTLTQEDMPLLLHRKVVQPESLLDAEFLTVIAANGAAQRAFPDRIETMHPPHVGVEDV
jgi:hypothetical protein